MHQLHGIAGACIAYEEYGIRDQGILMGIAFHSGTKEEYLTKTLMLSPKKKQRLRD